MDLARGLARRREGEAVRKYLDIDCEEVGAVGEFRVPDMRHRGFELVFDSGVGFGDEEFDEPSVPVLVAVDVQDILDNFFAVVESEPELLVIEGREPIG